MKTNIVEKDSSYNDLEILRKVNESLAMAKYHRTPIGSQLEISGQDVTVCIPHEHVLYDIIFDLQAISMHREKRTDNTTKLARRIYEKCQRIINLLHDGSKIAMNLDEEDKRWAFFMSNLSHAICSMYTHRMMDIKPFDTQARELFKALRPHFGAHHRILSRYCKAQKFDLDVLMGCYYNEYEDLPIAESYLTIALRNMPSCILIGSPQYKSAMYVIHNELSGIHFKRGDYLAAEVQYDHAMRFISQNVALISTQRFYDFKVHITHDKLAAHYCEMDQWEDEKRLRAKTVEVCDLFLTRTMLGSINSIIKSDAQKVRLNSLLRLNAGSFFNEMPRRFLDLVASTDPVNSKITMISAEHYLKVLTVLKSSNLLDEKGCHADSNCLKIDIKSNSDISKFFTDALATLFPKLKKQQKKKHLAKSAEPMNAAPPQANEIAELQPLKHIATNWKQQQKQTPARQNRGNKAAALPKDKHDPKFFIDQHRPVPPVACWRDAKFGELVFNRNDPHCEVIILRNDHNCGKPVFGFLPTKSILTRLCKHYNMDESEKILSEIQRTFSEARQAGFYGRGLKSCTTLPELRNTDYKLVLKPSKDFRPIVRLFGRPISTQSGHTLYILDAINCHPKSAASKIEVLQADEICISIPFSI